MLPTLGFVEDNFIQWEGFVRSIPGFQVGQRFSLIRHMISEWYSYPDMYAGYLAKRGYRAIRFIPSMGVKETTSYRHRLGHEVVRIPVKTVNTTGVIAASNFIRQILKEIRSRDVRTVHFNTYHSSYFAMSPPLASVTKILSQYSGGEPPYGSSITRTLTHLIPVKIALKASSAVLIEDYGEELSRHKRILERYYKVPKNKMMDFPLLCVYPSVFFERNREEAAKRVGLDPKITHLLCVSSIPSPNASLLAKNPMLVLKIFARMMSRSPREANLHFVGYGPGARNLEEEVRRYGLASKVTLHGIVDHEELPWYYSASDIIFNPAMVLDVRVGTVSIEAFACRRPVVLFRRHQGLAFEQLGGFLMMPDPVAGAEELRRIIDDPDLMRRKGREGEEIAKRYNVDSVGRRLEEIYWRILNKPSVHQL